MKRLLAVFIALVVAAAWLWGCAASPGAVAPPQEPTAAGSPAAGDQSGDAASGTDTPTPSPKSEGLAATPTCTPLGEEEAMAPQPDQGTPEASVPYEARRLVQMAKEDLARRLNLSLSEISVIYVEAVDWPDTSLGCPQPGMMYAQVVTPGFRVVLEAAGQAYEYHTDEGSSVILCQGGGSDVVPLMPVAPHGIPGKPPESGD